MNLNVSAGGAPRDVAAELKKQIDEAAPGNNTATSIGESLSSYVRSFDDGDQVSVTAHIHVQKTRAAEPEPAAVAAATSAPHQDPE